MLKHFGTPSEVGSSPPRASFRISGRLGDSSGLYRNIASSLGTLFLTLVLMLFSLGLILQPEPISWLWNVSDGHQTGSASVWLLESILLKVTAELLVLLNQATVKFK